MTGAELTAKVHTLRELQATIDQLQAEAEAIRDCIKAEMYQRDAETLTGPDWQASWKNVRSARLDTKALKAERPEIAARYTKEVVTCRFCLK